MSGALAGYLAPLDGCSTKFVLHFIAAFLNAYSLGNALISSPHFFAC